jgi:hypothetical protein
MSRRRITNAGSGVEQLPAGALEKVRDDPDLVTVHPAPSSMLNAKRSQWRAVGPVFPEEG